MKSTIEPWAYLHDVLNRLTHKPSNEKLTQLLPDQWLITNPNHLCNITQTRQKSENNLYFLVRLQINQTSPCGIKAHANDKT